jgi:hypothetical protein
MSFSQFLLTILTAGGGGALVAFGILRAFGEKWLDSKFANRLQELRHQHERQMEAARLESSRVLDRSSRLTEREFEVSAEAWSLAYEAYGQTMSALPGFRRTADLSRASDKVAKRVAEGSDLDEFEIAELLSKPPADRNTYYWERLQAHQTWDAKEAVRVAHRYLAKNALFIQKDVHERLTGFVDEAWYALVDLELVREMRGDGPIPEGIRRADEDFRNTAETKMKDIEQFVRERFWGPPPANGS